jgi:hypothetical protein
MNSQSLFCVSPDGHFLQFRDGRPFFWLADTGWTMLQRLDCYETLKYLDDRAAKGFNVVQTMGIMEFDGLRVPSRANGEVPLLDLNPETPNIKYWQHVKWVAQEMKKREMYLALLPIWGDKWAGGGIGPVVLNPQNASAFGRWLGELFSDTDLFWLLGGDRIINNEAQYHIMERMARGLREGDQGRNLISFHPNGNASSSYYFHQDDWLDFNMFQTAHTHPSRETFTYIGRDYRKTPPKPVLDGEPRYEDHPIYWNYREPAQWDQNNGYFDDLDARKVFYMSVFAGACGHTYGANSVFQTDRRELAPGTIEKFGSRLHWREALQLPGAGQMQWGKRALEERAYFSRIPDQSIVRGDMGEGSDTLVATRDDHGSFALIYVPSQRTFEVDTGVLRGAIVASWLDPRTGEKKLIGEYSPGGWTQFTSPHDGPDWVLALDV